MYVAECSAEGAKANSPNAQNSKILRIFYFSLKMTNNILTPSFHVFYSKKLNQLSRSIKIDIWRRLTSRKYPLSLEQASGIHPEVEDMLNQAVEKYIKQKERQKMKPITSDCETSLRQENEELCISKRVLEKRIEELLDLQEQYKSREIAMTRSLEKSGEKVTQLSDSVALFKSIIL